MKNDIYKYLTKAMMAKLDALIAEKGSDVIYNEVAKNIYENRLAECLGMEDAYEEVSLSDGSSVYKWQAEMMNPNCWEEDLGQEMLYYIDRKRFNWDFEV